MPLARLFQQLYCTNDRAMFYRCLTERAGYNNVLWQRTGAVVGLRHGHVERLARRIGAAGERVDLRHRIHEHDCEDGDGQTQREAVRDVAEYPA